MSRHFLIEQLAAGRDATYLARSLSGHAVNGDMLRALGITHVVSVGETLSQEPCVIHGHYVHASNLSGNHGHSKKNMEGAITM